MRAALVLSCAVYFWRVLMLLRLVLCGVFFCLVWCAFSVFLFAVFFFEQVDGTKEQPITIKGPSSGDTAIVRGSDKSGACFEINHDYYVLDVRTNLCTAVLIVQDTYSICQKQGIWSMLDFLFEMGTFYNFSFTLRPCNDFQVSRLAVNLSPSS